MAKLSARGRYELVEVSKELPGYNMSNGEPLTTWERLTKRLMSDGTILEKRDVRFAPEPFNPEGRYYSYGWKVAGKIKPGLSVAQFAEVYAKSGKWTVTGRTDSQEVLR